MPPQLVQDTRTFFRVCHLIVQAGRLLGFGARSQLASTVSVRLSVGGFPGSGLVGRVWSVQSVCLSVLLSAACAEATGWRVERTLPQ